MKKNGFKLSAITISMVMGLSGVAVAETTSPIAVKDVTALSKNSAGYYTGGGAVHIGGEDSTFYKEGIQNNYFWERINMASPGTSGLEALNKLAGYNVSATAGADNDGHHALYENEYQRVVRGERLITNLAKDAGYGTPVGVVDGLNMGTADQRYQKVQDISLYQVDKSGNIIYQKNAEDGSFVLDADGHKIPLTVASTQVELDRNSDVYIRRQERVGGQIGLQNSAIYSKVKSFGNDVAAVTVDADLRENGITDRARDVVVVKDTVIDNTLNSDVYGGEPSHDASSNEIKYQNRPEAIGLQINADSVHYNLEDANGVTKGSETKTNVVPTAPNIVLDHVNITGQNLAAERQDNHYIKNGYYNGNQGYYRADDASTALQIEGSGLYASIGNNSVLKGGLNNEGKSLAVKGHANRINIENSTLKGDVNINHDGYAPEIQVQVVKDAKTGRFSAVGINGNTGIVGYTPSDRLHDGTTLNIANSVVSGDILSQGDYDGFVVNLYDVTDKGYTQLTQAQIQGETTAKAIYDNAVNSVANTIRTNNGNAYTPVSINLDHSVLNGRVDGISHIDYPGTAHNPIVSWNADLTVTNGAVWNAAATDRNESGAEDVVSNVHDFNLSNSQLNLVNTNTTTPTLGGRGVYEDVSTARVVVHGDMSQNKDDNGNYQTSEIVVGKAVVNPLVYLGGEYLLGSMQVKGSVNGNYLLTMKNSGVEPYAKAGYLSSYAGENKSTEDDAKAHSFVNYKGTGSDAHFVGRTELGVYQYDVVDEANDARHDERNVYFKSTGRLSNSAATAMSMDASMNNIATMETDNLREHMMQSRHANDEGGVWVSYYGGKNRNTTAGGAGYNLETNGVMLGVDNVFDAKKGGNWLAGLAFSSARSDLDVRNSRGDLDSYGAQFYLSRRWDNGIFVDTSAQFNHFSNSTKVHMLDGQRAHKDYSSNGYGLGMKAGYTWSDYGFFAEPYIAATGRTFDGAHYTLNNGMVVDGDDYKSLLGEVGAHVGYTFDLANNSYIKPYFHLAGLNEFADSNKMKINNKNLDNSIDGAAVQVGLGAEVKVMKDFGGYASFNYTGGDNMERPWEARVGVNYTW